MPQFESVDYDPFAQGELQDFAPSTAPQRELWLGSLLGGDDANRAFNECLILRLEGNINPAALQSSLQELVRRHEALRGTFSGDGELFLIAKPTLVELVRVDLSELMESEKQAKYEALKLAEVQNAFDLKNGPLFRATLISLSASSHRFLFSAHHIVCDGWSAGVLMIELAALYRATISEGDPRRAKLPRPTSALAHAKTQQERELSVEGQADIDFWLKHLAPPLPVLNLPIDGARPAERTYASKRIDIELASELTRSLRQLGAKNGCTMLVTFLGAIQTWLYLKTGQDDVVLGVPAAGQIASGQQSLVGHWVHLLPIRSKIDKSQSFVENLKTNKRTTLDCLDHQQVTYSSLLPKLRLPHDPSRIALVPMCVNIDVGLEKLDFGGADVEYETIPRCFESFEFFINAVDHKSHLVLECSFNTNLFEERTIRQWVSEFSSLCKELCDSSHLAVSSLRSVTANQGNAAALSHQSPLFQMHAAFEALNATDQSRAHLPVHVHFQTWAERTPNYEAVCFNGKTVTYGELERTSNQLAHALLAQGVKLGDCIGVCLPRSENLLAVLLGILKAGAAYVPMDPSYPKARLQAMVDDAGVRVVIGDLSARDNLPQTEAQLYLSELLQNLTSFSSSRPGVTVQGSDRAYILFTSGSTGRPKGVDVPHRAFENVLLAIAREPGMVQKERLLAITTISFDIAGVELFLPLVCGGTVVLCSAEQAADPYELSSLLKNERIDYLQATPATWTMLIGSGWEGSPKLRVVSTGEAFAPELAKPLLARAGGGVWNLYGPTETTVYSSIKRVLPGQRVTIGRPIDNTQFYILDEAMQPVAPGEVGELWISGIGVSSGYIGRPELTAERFVSDPFRVGQTMYKSGDLSRLNADGEVECLGRIDFQVKVRGFRIELGEIEAAIAESDLVQRCVVDVRELGEGDQRIVAYVTPHPNVELNVASLLRHLSTKLTPYMIPQHVVAVDPMPLTPNGKVDRKALAQYSLTSDTQPNASSPVATDPILAPQKSGASQQASVGAAASASATSIEDELTRIWLELLQLESVSTTAGFFDLGGHSMLAVRMLSRIRASLGVEIPLRVVFKEQTIEKLTQWIQNTTSTDGQTAKAGAVPALQTPSHAVYGDGSPDFPTREKTTKSGVTFEEIEF